MKTETLRAMLIAIGVLLTVKAQADLIGQTGTLTLNYGSPQQGNGGAFQVNSATLGTFETFCLEYNEEFNPSSTYQYTYQINTGAVAGDLGATTVNHRALGYGQSMDNISIGTAYLYSQFRNGGMTVTTGPQAAELQCAIWYLEGEKTLTEIAAGGGLNGANIGNVETLVSIAEAQTKSIWNSTPGGSVFEDSNGAYGVVALNLFYDSAGTQNSQDQLAIVPEPTTVLAGLVLIIPLGASTVRILRNKKQVI